MRTLLTLWALTSTVVLAAEPPRLGVVIIIDQLSVEAWAARAGREKAGLKRLREHGFSFAEATYESAPTVTAAGHATLATGTWPRIHGIVANQWVDGDTGEKRLSAQDAAYQVLGRDPRPRDCTAPSAMRAPTLSDAIRAHDPKALSVVISGKDRSAIASAGFSPTAAVWLDTERPMFTTSTWYAKTMPAFLSAANESFAQAALKNAFAWGLPGGGITGKNPMPPKKKNDDEPWYERAEVQSTIDRLEVDAALAAVKQYALGADGVPDLLTISFSGHDRIGHRFGPDAAESLSEYDVVDHEIGRLLEGLDAQVGAGRYVVALTADHGTAHAPEVLKARGIDAGRVDTPALKDALEKVADAALGPNDYFIGYEVPGLNVNPKVREKLVPLFAQLKKAALAQPGVLDFISSAELLTRVNPDETAQRYLRGFVPGRSPDYIIVTRANWLLGPWETSAHVSTWHYDRAVPQVWFGAGITAGHSTQAVQAIDLAPTMASLLQVPPPAGSEGRVLSLTP